jgi:hypothetical protein
LLLWIGQLSSCPPAGIEQPAAQVRFYGNDLIVHSSQGRKMVTISGRVLDASERPIPMARIYFISGPTALPDVAALTNEDGQFTLSAPCAGNYEISITADDFVSTTIRVTLKQGEQAAVVIRLERRSE